MRILSSADWHLSNRQTIAGRFVLQNGMNLTLIDRVKALEKICFYVEKEGVDLVIIPGDIFDTSNPEAVAIKVAVHTIERLAGWVPVIICSGNHDWKGGVAGALAPFGKLARMNGIYVSEHPEFFSLTIRNTKVNLFILPYPRRSELKENQELKSASPEEISIYVSRKMEENISAFSATIERDAVNILVGHFTAVGGSYSKEQNIPIFDINVRREFLEPFDLTCLGHLHAPQPYYSGSIARNGFGEQDQKVGFKVYDIQPGEKPVEQFIDLPAREYFTVSPEEFLKQLSEDIHYKDGVAVRVKGKVRKPEYDELMQKIKAENLQFFKNTIEIESETAGSNGGDVSEEPTLEQALKLWADGRPGMDKFIDRLIVKGREIEAKIMEVGINGNGIPMAGFIL